MSNSDPWGNDKSSIDDPTGLSFGASSFGDDCNRNASLTRKKPQGHISRTAQYTILGIALLIIALSVALSAKPTISVKSDDAINCVVNTKDELAFQMPQNVKDIVCYSYNPEVQKWEELDGHLVEADEGDPLYYLPVERLWVDQPVVALASSIDGNNLIICEVSLYGSIDNSTHITVEPSIEPVSSPTTDLNTAFAAIKTPTISPTPTILPTPTIIPTLSATLTATYQLGTESAPKSQLYYIYDQSLRWYQQQLSSHERQLFSTVYDAIAEQKLTVTLPKGTYTEADINKVMYVLANDCPELMHFDSEKGYTWRTVNKHVVDISLQYTYPTLQQSEMVITQAIELIRAMDVQGASTNLLLEEKLYRQIVAMASYNISSEHCAYADSILLYRQGKCTGYAFALNLALRMHGIPCIYVEGEVENDNNIELHAWNMVQIDGIWTMVDATFDRAIYETVKDMPSPADKLLLNFNKTDAEMKKTHTAYVIFKERGLKQPSCTDTSYSFWNTVLPIPASDYKTWDNDIAMGLCDVVTGRSQTVILHFDTSKAYEQAMQRYNNSISEWMTITGYAFSYMSWSNDKAHVLLLYDIKLVADNIYRTSPFWVRYFDVGDADAALVYCEGHYMLVDGGNDKDGSMLYTYLHYNDIRHIDAMVISHPHSDHAGGLPAAFEVPGMNVDVVYSTTLHSDNRRYQILMEKAKEYGLTPTILDKGDTFTLGSAIVTVLGPDQRKMYEDANNKSLILMVTYGDTSFLFTGDAMENAENDLLLSGEPLKCTVLKAAHHGAAGSSSEEFLQASSPMITIISCEKGNDRRPDDTTYKRIQDNSRVVYRTDVNGDISIFSDGEAVSGITER